MSLPGFSLLGVAWLVLNVSGGCYPNRSLVNLDMSDEKIERRLRDYFAESKSFDEHVLDAGATVQAGMIGVPRWLDFQVLPVDSAQRTVDLPLASSGLMIHPHVVRGKVTLAFSRGGSLEDIEIVRLTRSPFEPLDPLLAETDKMYWGAAARIREIRLQHPDIDRAELSTLRTTFLCSQEPSYFTSLAPNHEFVLRLAIVQPGDTTDSPPVITVRTGATEIEPSDEYVTIQKDLPAGWVIVNNARCHELSRVPQEVTLWGYLFSIPQSRHRIEVSAKLGRATSEAES